MADRPVPSSFDDLKEYQETGWQKISRKLKEEPLIPLGCGLTTLALINAWRAMRKGDHVGVQRMFRARVGAQAFTVIAMVAGGTYYGKDREKRKELIKLEAQQRAEERQAKWLHELEVRDEEDKAIKEAVRRKKERVEARKERDEKMVADANAAGSEGGKKEGGGVVDAVKSAGGWFGSSKPAESKPEDSKDGK